MFEYTIQVIQHFMVRVTNDLKTQQTQVSFTLPVFCSLRFFGVNVAINFNNE